MSSLVKFMCLLRSVLPLGVLFGCSPGLCDFGEVI